MADERSHEGCVLHLVLNIRPLRLLIGVEDIRAMSRYPAEPPSKAGHRGGVPQDQDPVRVDLVLGKKILKIEIHGRLYRRRYKA
jgi:hypothetical protein